MRSRDSSLRGVVALELALWLPVLLVLALAGVRWVTAVSYQGQLHDAVRAGLQWVMQSPSRANDVLGMEAVVRDNLWAASPPVVVTARQLCACAPLVSGLPSEVSCVLDSCLAPDVRPWHYLELKAETVYLLPMPTGVLWPEYLNLQAAAWMRLD